MTFYTAEPTIQAIYQKTVEKFIESDSKAEG